MPKIYFPSAGPDDWKRFLDKPELHWATGRSARTTAHAWEAAEGAPPEVEAVLGRALGPVRLLLAIPEHKTPLPGGSRDSQTDVFALFRTDAGLVAAAVEAKVEEPFGPLVSEWLAEASPGKTERLAHVCGRLGLDPSGVGDLHYQLLHRTAAAVIEAERFHASTAAMVVHSFSPHRTGFDAFARFAARLGAPAAEPDRPAVVPAPGGAPLVLGWACGDPRFLTA